MDFLASWPRCVWHEPFWGPAIDLQDVLLYNLELVLTFDSPYQLLQIERVAWWLLLDPTTLHITDTWMLGRMAEASQKGHSYLVPPASPSWQSGNGALPLLQVWTSPCSDWSESSKKICGQPLWATRAFPGNAEGTWPLKCGSGHRVLQLQL